MTDIQKSFDGVHASNRIHLELKEGEVHALLGENGAGRSTSIRALDGTYRPDRGITNIGGEDVEMNSVQVVREHEVGIIHQEIVLILHLTVVENIFLSRKILDRFGFKNTGGVLSRTQETLKEPELDIGTNTKVMELTITQQRMVEVVKTSFFNVKTLVMGEPTSSLSDEGVEKLFETMTRLKEQKVSIIYISHRVEELFHMADGITVIRGGTCVGAMNTKEADTDESVAVMAGRDLQDYYIRDYDTLEEDSAILGIENLTKKRAFNNISFRVKKGEILGFAGLVGADRNETMICVFGANRSDSGHVLLKGKEIRFRDCLEVIDNDVIMMVEDGKEADPTLIDPIAFNTALFSLRYYTKGLLLNDARKEGVTQEYIRGLSIKMLSSDVPVGNVSGGNRQKVVATKMLATKPRILILDGPTRGVDVGARAEIYSIINELARQGMAIIMISSELPEIINVCDNIYVVKEGVKTEEIACLKLTQERIIELATGVQNVKNNSFMRMLEDSSRITAVLAVIPVILDLVSPVFLTMDNLLSIFRQISNNMYLALGMALVTISGGVDLSVGACVTMCGTLTADLMVDQGMPVIPTIAVGLLPGILTGFLNGLIIAAFKMPTLIVTMSVMNVAKNVAYIYSGGRSIRVSNDMLTGVGIRKLFGVLPFPVVYMIVLIIIFTVVLNETKFGTYVFAIGDDGESAKLSGVPIKKVGTAVLIISGFLVVFIGIVLSTRAYSGQPRVSEGYGLGIITTYVLGDMLVIGGMGAASGTILGALVIGIISNGLNLIELSSLWQPVMKDLIIILAVIVDTQKGKDSAIRRVIRNAKGRV